LKFGKRMRGWAGADLLVVAGELVVGGDIPEPTCHASHQRHDLAAAYLTMAGKDEPLRSLRAAMA
jgi:hypothetical protein